MTEAYLSFAALFMSNGLAVVAYDRNDKRLLQLALAMGLIATAVFHVDKHLSLALASALIISSGVAYGLGFLRQGNAQAIGVSCVALWCLLLALHRVPGVTNMLVFANVVISHDARPFTLYANFDKGIAGLILLAAMSSFPYSAYAKKQRDIWPNIAAVVSVALAMCLVGAFAGLRFDPKWTAQSLPFLLVNGFLTCIPEEVFFRGYLYDLFQRHTDSTRSRAILPILGTALIFALVHSGGGWKYTVLAGLLGVGLGWIRSRTSSLCLPVAAHWLTNALHFLFLTYPFPQPMM